MEFAKIKYFIGMQLVWVNNYDLIYTNVALFADRLSPLV
jgi:hypothetical protein